ncbi:hypothetical protein [Xanthomonas bonasiae]|uniref:hypothetical protein n=1 Tax=Xanthomonas bonasiae TaxID=2810351 RepID=UPI00177AF993|nr:hypothetical protein [Xanthomonas surreyensis]MBD7922368.1 hypothetical protein [Xanthomonas surreyensis]MBD7923167.1 hypothetical protein [Xanthomonas surreyensis]
MKNFSPVDLKARHAILSGEPGNVSLTLLMSPFLVDGTLVDTSVRLDGVNLPSNLLSDLAGKSFVFPVNPQEGYIDGSIYLDDRHHPVDVTSLTFNCSRAGGLTLLVKGTYLFSVEGLVGLGNMPFQMAAPVSSCAA